MRGKWTRGTQISQGDYWERSLEPIRWTEVKREDDSQPHAMLGWSWAWQELGSSSSHLLSDRKQRWKVGMISLESKIKIPSHNSAPQRTKLCLKVPTTGAVSCRIINLHTWAHSIHPCCTLEKKVVYVSFTVFKASNRSQTEKLTSYVYIFSLVNIKL